MWDAGSLFLADHALVHAGPVDPSTVSGRAGPRVVLFTTFLVTDDLDSGAAGEAYDVRDQYMPYFLAEDASMPPTRARALLREWAGEKPWLHYAASSQARAVQALCLAKDEDLPPRALQAHVDTLRA